mmetsp:Transcript_16999/g.23777  ORF Transcript_16999/g.23777 Transcript_16999/m.23777 type:complete len:181 (+) Transcript_16999:1-543(+)
MASSPLPSLPAVESLDTLEAFTEAVSVLFEPAPPLAKSLFEAHKADPMKSYKEIISKAKAEVAKMSSKDKLEVINAHPRIGQKDASKLSKFSKIEQGMSEDKKLSSEEEKVLSDFQTLNADYEKKFGFKFIIFVNGRPKKDLLPIGRERMENTREEELATGIQAMMDIALDRLKKIEAAA